MWISGFLECGLSLGILYVIAYIYCLYTQNGIRTNSQRTFSQWSFSQQTFSQQTFSQHLQGVHLANFPKKNIIITCITRNDIEIYFILSPLHKCLLLHIKFGFGNCYLHRIGIMVMRFGPEYHQEMWLQHPYIGCCV